MSSAEKQILSANDVIAVVLAAKATQIYPHVVVLLSTGVRRGELMGLRWGDVDLEAAKLRVARSLEIISASRLRIKEAKTRHGRRNISLPAIAVEALRDHRRAQLEARIKLGIGKLTSSHYVFGDFEGKALNPERITYQWKRFVVDTGLPTVTLHALRHSHASALIAAGQDVVTVSRRLGHASPTITLSIYAHLFANTDESAATAIEAVLKPSGTKS